MRIENNISRQRRQDVIDKGVNIGTIEETYVYPMLGGRNIAKWKVKSNEFMLVPHTTLHKYGVPEADLAREAPDTFMWLSYYHDELLATRIQNGKFFNPKINPFYRLDNVGEYTYSPYKVLWKEQSDSMSAVVVSTYYQSIPNANRNIFSQDKIIVVDSKVLMLDAYNEFEAYFVCGIINSPNVINVVDGYAVSTNRGVDVLKYIAIPKYDHENDIHIKIAMLSKEIHRLAADNQPYSKQELLLSKQVQMLFTKQ